MLNLFNKISINCLHCSQSTVLFIMISHVIGSADLAFYSVFVTGPKP